MTHALIPLAEVLQLLKSAQIVAALAHPADLALMLRQELAARGQDAAGEWVGFPAAKAALLGGRPPVASCYVSANRYRGSHQREPRGRGGWLFETKDGDVVFRHSGTYAEARRSAVAFGKQYGHVELFTCP
jgi:hypothetical protein